MSIASVELYPFVSPRQYATVIAHEGGQANQAVQRSYFLFVKLTTDDGLVGWGEASDIPKESLPATDDFRKELADLMRGRDPFDVQQMHHDFDQHFRDGHAYGSSSTGCALDLAMHDLQGKIARRPVYSLLGGAVRREVVVSWVAYIRSDLEALREEIRQKKQQGFRAYKLKVGVDIDLDEQRLATLRQEAGREASIKVDANAGWSVETAPGNIRRLARFHLVGVETPVPRENPRDIAAVRKQVDVPILEHASDMAYALSLLKADAVDVINLSTPGAGGLWPARQVAALAKAGGVGVLLGSTVELCIGTLAQLHLAATIPNLTLPSDLIGPGMYTRHVLKHPPTYHQGTLRIPGGIGLGGEVDESKLTEAPK